MRQFALQILALICLAAPIVRAAPGEIKIEFVQPPAEISRDDGRSWDPASTNSASLKPGHRVRTGEKGKVTLRMGDLTAKHLDELSSFVVREDASGMGARLLKGASYFFNRDKPGRTQVEGPMVGAVIKGTEFLFEVSEAGISRVVVLEGEVSLTNHLGEITLTTGMSGEAGPELAPRRLPGLVSDMAGAIQWVLYYPGVLDVSELKLSAEEKQSFAPALEAYAAGDLRAALQLAPAANNLQSPSAQTFLAALDLAAGQASRARAKIASLKNPQARGLRWLSDAVQLKVHADELNALDEHSLTASELLALSYARQALRDLPAALRAAKLAAGKSAAFGYAWERVAELEFSFGNAAESSAALEKALTLSPRNAQAAALNGFVLAAQNKIGRARAAFESAIALDGALANGWLGRGLIRIRQGDEQGGREDLLMAAAMEPQRGFLRSYLAKALHVTGNGAKAARELQLAKEMDPADPTPWLYSALISQNENRVNDAVRELQRSQDRAGNRALYRSSFLLDEDRSAQSAHLATIYRDASMQEQSRHEAAASLTRAYANPAAHIFLAESYLSLDRVSLRYESARVSEYLLANLLAPAGAGAWSPGVSQQEYSALFDQDGAGLLSNTEYRSNGRWTQSGAVYGNWGGTSVTLDGLYHSDPGFRANQDVEIASATFQLKQQITPADTFYLQPLWASATSGDLTEYYSDAQANTTVRVRETQEPIFLAGWRHDWGPGHKTLLLLSRLHDQLEIDNPSGQIPRFNQPFGAPLVGRSVAFDESYESRFVAYAAEAQQIFVSRLGDTVIGARVQTGNLEARSGIAQTGPTFPPLPDRSDSIREGADRYSAYAYQSWKAHERIEFVAGLTYDGMQSPSNYRFAPLTAGDEWRDKISPKAGFTADLWAGATWRAAYAQALGGLGFDQSFRLEPTQVAGINQRYRSLTPEAVAGSLNGEDMELAGADFSQQLAQNTWVNLSVVWLSSEADRRFGAVRSAFPAPTVSFVDSQLDYRERFAHATINRLIARDLALGASYSISEATLRQTAGDVPDLAARNALIASDRQAILQQAALFASINHPSGFFARAETVWTHQSNRLDLAPFAGDDFWQGHLHAGWRFAQRRAEIAFALLNISDERYQLEPLNLYSRLARERTLVVSLRWQL